MFDKILSNAAIKPDGSIGLPLGILSQRAASERFKSQSLVTRHYALGDLTPGNIDDISIKTQAQVSDVNHRNI